MCLCQARTLRGAFGKSQKKCARAEANLINAFLCRWASPEQVSDSPVPPCSGRV